MIPVANVERLDPSLPSPTFGTGGVLWASLTLALLTLPVVIVATEEALAAVPNSMREGSYACGASKWQTTRLITLRLVMPAILGALIAIVGFATLMTRLQMTTEGYRLSALHDEIAKLQDENRGLRLTAAQLSSHERLRALAPQYHLAPPGRGQVVMLP